VPIERLAIGLGQRATIGHFHGHGDLAARGEEQQIGQHPARALQDATGQVRAPPAEGKGEPAAPQPSRPNQQHIGLRAASQDLGRRAGGSQLLALSPLHPARRIDQETIAPLQTGHDRVDHDERLLPGVVTVLGQLGDFQCVDQSHQRTQHGNPVNPRKHHRPQRNFAVQVTQQQRRIDVARMIRHYQGRTTQLLQRVQARHLDPIPQPQNSLPQPPKHRS